MPIKLRHVDWGLVLVLAFVFCIAIALLQLLNEIGDAERGLMLYETTCPLNAGLKLYEIGEAASPRYGQKSSYEL